ncbi:MAG: NTP transferase domain-containing protein, partial [Rhodospirillaceae bacterium]
MHDTPKIAGIVLAAGLSTRAAPLNKLLVDFQGAPMVRRTAEALLASQAGPVVCVTGHMRDAVAGALAGLDVGLVHNPDYAAGMAGSLAAGIAALPEDAAGALVALGDM